MTRGLCPPLDIEAYREGIGAAEGRIPIAGSETAFARSEEFLNRVGRLQGRYRNSPRRAARAVVAGDLVGQEGE